jgi:hypothetical protein
MKIKNLKVIKYSWIINTKKKSKFYKCHLDFAKGQIKKLFFNAKMTFPEKRKNKLITDYY